MSTGLNGQKVHVIYIYVHSCFRTKNKVCVKVILSKSVSTDQTSVVSWGRKDYSEEHYIRIKLMPVDLDLLGSPGADTGTPFISSLSPAKLRQDGRSRLWNIVLWPREKQRECVISHHKSLSLKPIKQLRDLLIYYNRFV